MYRSLRARTFPILQSAFTSNSSLPRDQCTPHSALFVINESQSTEDSFTAFLRHSQCLPNSVERVNESLETEVGEIRRVKDFVLKLESPMKRLWLGRKFPLPSEDMRKREGGAEDAAKSRRDKSRKLMQELVRAYTNVQEPGEEEITKGIPSIEKMTADELLCVFLYLDIPAPSTGDGGDSRRFSHLVTELASYFDFLLDDSKTLTAKCSKEELFCACLDRGIDPERAGWESLTRYMEREQRGIGRLGESRTYEEIARTVPGVLFPELFSLSNKAS